MRATDNILYDVFRKLESREFLHEVIVVGIRLSLDQTSNKLGHLIENGRRHWLAHRRKTVSNLIDDSLRIVDVSNLRGESLTERVDCLKEGHRAVGENSDGRWALLQFHELFEELGKAIACLFVVDGYARQHYLIAAVDHRKDAQAIALARVGAILKHSVEHVEPKQVLVAVVVVPHGIGNGDYRAGVVAAHLIPIHKKSISVVQQELLQKLVVLQFLHVEILAEPLVLAFA